MEMKYPDGIQEKPSLENTNYPPTTNYPNANQNPQLIQPPQANIQLKKKNRTLQFYKFLFYSMKVEIKLHEFLDLVRFANQSEIVLWILSLILYCNTPNNFSTTGNGDYKETVKYKNVFIWIHLVHVIRGIIGFYIWMKLPKSYQVIEAMKGTPDAQLEKKLFNDLARETIDAQVLKPLASKKILLFIYFGLTFLNFIFDIIDFLVVLSGLNSANTDSVVILLTYLMIALLYVIIDLSYFFWGGFLKYSFPPKYLGSIHDAFSGAVNKVLVTFKIRKPVTDVKKEAEVQGEPNTNQQQPQTALPQLNDQIVSGNNNNQLPNNDEIRIDL